MCKFCEIKNCFSEPNGESLSFDTIDFGVLGEGYAESFMSKPEEESNTALEIVFFGPDTNQPIYAKRIAVKYCPMCGRKLMEEKENVQ